MLAASFETADEKCAQKPNVERDPSLFTLASLLSEGAVPQSHGGEGPALRGHGAVKGDVSALSFCPSGLGELGGVGLSQKSVCGPVTP